MHDKRRPGLLLFLFCCLLKSAKTEDDSGGAPSEVLLLAEQGSGAQSFVRALFARATDYSTYYVLWDPCRHVRAKRSVARNITHQPFSSKDCGLLTQRLFACSLEARDLPLLKHSIMPLGWKVHNTGDSSVLEQHRRACLGASLRIVKESRFLPPSLLLRTETLLLHFLRDPRDLIASRINVIEKDKKHSNSSSLVRAVARAVCNNQRLSLQTLAALQREGRQRRKFWLDRKYHAIRWEDATLEPALLADHTLAWTRGNWRTHEQTVFAAAAAAAAAAATAADTSGEVELFAQGQEKWRFALDAPALQATMRECAAVIAGLKYPMHRWQTTSAVSLGDTREDGSSRQSLGLKHSGRLKSSKQYSRAAVEAHSKSRCGHLWQPIQGLGGIGGSSAACAEVSSSSLAACAHNLRAQVKCHALTYYAGDSLDASLGRCLLHDRRTGSFHVQPQRGAVHVVRSVADLDSCEPADGSTSAVPSLSSTQHLQASQNNFMTASHALLEHLAQGNFGNHTGTISGRQLVREQSKVALDERLVYVEFVEKAAGKSTPYPSFDFMALAECYRRESSIGAYPWDDETRPDLAQNMAHVWVYEALRQSPLRTLDISKASLAVLPFDTVISSKLKRPCLGKTHDERMRSLAFEVQRWLHEHDKSTSTLSREVVGDDKNESDPVGRKLGQRYKGVPVLVMGLYWATYRDWGGKVEKLRRSGRFMQPASSSTAPLLWPMLAPHAVLVTIDEFFTHDWNKVITAPYWAHADVSRRLMEANQVARPIRQVNGRSVQDHSVTLMDGRTIQLYFRGGVDHGSMCKRPVPPRKHEVSDGSRTATWLRKAAVEYFSLWNERREIKFIATGDRQTTYSDASLTPLMSHLRNTSTSYARSDYVNEITSARFCIHLQGDTTTSRRLFDSIAARCIPVIIADGVNLPFASQVDWESFSIQVPEVEVLRGKSEILEAIMQSKISPEKICTMQYHLTKARHDLLWGIGGSFNQTERSKQFKSRALDHLLQQAMELQHLPRHARYRRFRPAFDKCLGV